MTAPQSDSERSEFEQAGEEPALSLIHELWLFVLDNKKYWLIPIVAVLGLVGLLVVLGTTGAAPFIYTLF